MQFITVTVVRLNGPRHVPIASRGHSPVPMPSRSTMHCGGGAIAALIWYFFFFQAEDGIRDLTVTGVQTCALPIFPRAPLGPRDRFLAHDVLVAAPRREAVLLALFVGKPSEVVPDVEAEPRVEIGRASCRERV